MTGNEGDKRSSGFGYDYFDDPVGLGYRGYSVDESWERIAALCAEMGIRSALDIGCAKGFLVSALARRGIDAKGYDVSDYALSFADPARCSRRDVRDGVPDCADAVFVLGLLLYIERDELDAVLASLRKATRHYLFFSMYYLGEAQAVPDPLRTITETRAWWRSKLIKAEFQYKRREVWFDVYQAN